MQLIKQTTGTITRYGRLPNTEVIDELFLTTDRSYARSIEQKPQRFTKLLENNSKPNEDNDFLK